MTSAGALQGLSEQEVVARRARGQGNDAPLRTSRSYAQIVRENVFSFMNNVLFGLGIALALLGRMSDALVMVAVVLTNTIVSVVQELRAKRTLDRIALLTRPTATVIREGRERVVDPAEIVVGDVLAVRPGDQIVVDGQVIGAGRMDVDESLLTGEADHIPKRAGDAVYSGSFCVAGSARYEAQRVGAQSLARQFTVGAQAFRRVYTPLQRQINLVIRVILLIAIYFQLMLVIQSLVNDIPVVESVRMSAVIAGLVPNGLFLAIAVAYAMGAVRMAGQGALVQQANAVESLSNVDILCLDKTGTLTANAIQLQALAPVGLSEEELRRALGDYAASTPTPNRTSEALARACPGQARSICDQVPFSSELKWSALAFDAADDRGSPVLRGVYVLGAPEILRPYLAPDVDAAALNTQVEAWAASGLRVLLFAHHPAPLPLRDVAGQPRPPSDLVPLGLLSFSDQPRPGARETLRGFAQAGVQLKIISGDSPHTVAALATQAGFPPAARLISGLELAEMDEAQFAQAAEEGVIFGRITPQQKERLVQALRSQGHYVAMIGDGVNDVLSLKRANLGIAMQSGSQATRGVADIILLNDSFSALPHAFMEGQRILNGMQDILKLFLTRVLYAALLIASIGGVGGFPYAPKHNSLLTLLTVGIPSVALAAWARPGLVSRDGLVRSLLRFVLPAALSLSLVALGVYLLYYIPAYQAALAASPGDLRAASAAALPVAQSALTTATVFCGLLLIPFAEPPTRAWVGGDVLSGDWRPSALALAMLLVYVLALVVPALHDFFELTPLALSDYAVIAFVAAFWALALRGTWRARLLERFLNFDPPGGNQAPAQRHQGNIRG